MSHPIDIQNAIAMLHAEGYKIEAPVDNRIKVVSLDYTGYKHIANNKIELQKYSFTLTDFIPDGRVVSLKALIEKHLNGEMDNPAPKVNNDECLKGLTSIMDKYKPSEGFSQAFSPAPSNKEGYEILEYGYAQNNENEKELQYISKVKRLSDGFVLKINDVNMGREVEKFHVGWNGLEVHFKDGGATLFLEMSPNKPSKEQPLQQEQSSEPIMFVQATAEKLDEIKKEVWDAARLTHPLAGMKYVTFEDYKKSIE